jgi:hypothetical protein
VANRAGRRESNKMFSGQNVLGKVQEFLQAISSSCLRTVRETKDWFVSLLLTKKRISLSLYNSIKKILKFESLNFF